MKTLAQIRLNNGKLQVITRRQSAHLKGGEGDALCIEKIEIATEKIEVVM